MWSGFGDASELSWTFRANATKRAPDGAGNRIPWRGNEPGSGPVEGGDIYADGHGALAAAGENALEGCYVGVVAALGEGDVIGAGGGEQVGGAISAGTAGLASATRARLTPATVSGVSGCFSPCDYL